MKYHIIFVIFVIFVPQELKTFFNARKVITFFAVFKLANNLNHSLLYATLMLPMF